MELIVLALVCGVLPLVSHAQLAITVKARAKLQSLVNALLDISVVNML